MFPSRTGKGAGKHEHLRSVIEIHLASLRDKVTQIAGRRVRRERIIEQIEARAQSDETVSVHPAANDTRQMGSVVGLLFEPGRGARMNRAREADTRWFSIGVELDGVRQIGVLIQRLIDEDNIAAFRWIAWMQGRTL